MFFHTAAECADRARGLRFNADPKTNTLQKDTPVAEAVQISFLDQRQKSYQLAQQIESWLGDYGYCLFWVTELDIWPSSENLHLYYRLRSSYHDYREVHDAPGHLFLSHETADLVTFLNLALQFGWGGFLFGTKIRTYITISHDEWIRVESEEKLNAVVENAEGFSLPYKILRSRTVLDS
jgi:hypothetical protein